MAFMTQKPLETIYEELVALGSDVNGCMDENVKTWAKNLPLGLKKQKKNKKLPKTYWLNSIACKLVYVLLVIDENCDIILTLYFIFSKSICSGV